MNGRLYVEVHIRMCGHEGVAPIELYSCVVWLVPAHSFRFVRACRTRLQESPWCLCSLSLMCWQTRAAEATMTDACPLVFRCMLYTYAHFVSLHFPFRPPALSFLSRSLSNSLLYILLTSCIFLRTGTTTVGRDKRALEFGLFIIL